MGMPTMQVQQPDKQTDPEKRVISPGLGGQPQFGMPNQYSNTVGPWDNQQKPAPIGFGKGKGA